MKNRIYHSRMFANPSPEPSDSQQQKDQVLVRVDDWLTKQQNAQKRIHDKQLESRFEVRLRSIYGLDKWTFGDIEVRVDEMVRCGRQSVVALMTVRDEEGFDLLPDRRVEVLSDYRLNPSRPGIILEILSHPIQVTLVAPDGNPSNARIVPILCDKAFEELSLHRSAAVTRLKAVRSKDESSGYPVNQPSLLVNFVLREVAAAVRTRTIEAGINPDAMSWVPIRVDDLESNDQGVYDAKVSLADSSPGSSFVAGIKQEVHRVKVGFNRFFGTIERQWLSWEPAENLS